MHNPFPPEPNHTGAIRAAFNVLGSILPARSATYISSPITSGRRFVESVFLAESERDSLIKANLDHSREVVARLKKKVDSLVIDPAAMPDVEGWTQCDYRQMWVEVIERYVARVVFVHDWQFSRGCALEFATSIRNAIPTLDESLKEIGVSQGFAMISEAAEIMEQAGYDSAFHRVLLTDLQKAAVLT